MSGNGMKDIDFDEWAELYRQDPAAFEARRQAVLMLELARGDEAQRTAARESMARYERAARGLDGADRMKLSADFMLGSLSHLMARMGELRDSVADSDTRAGERASPVPTDTER